MYKQFFAGMPFVALPLFALGLFITFFVLAAIRTWFFQSRAELDDRAQQPLFDGVEVKP